MMQQFMVCMLQYFPKGNFCVALNAQTKLFNLFCHEKDMSEEKVTKMSFKELEAVTNKFSVQYGESIFGAIYKV